MKTLFQSCAVIVCVAIFSTPGTAYSVLTHEQVVDLAWEGQIQRMLIERFPYATPEDLSHAHAFAYVGSLVQDMGYYPFGKQYFSALLHYFCSGYFVSS